MTQKVIQDWRAEYDVITTLRASGHDVQVLGVLDSLVELRALIADWQPDVVFNLLEEFDGIVAYDQHVIAFLEMMRQPYTGCNPRGLLISRDKALCKQVFAFHRIPTPQFAIFRRGQRLRVPRSLRYPLFVKSSTDDASLGIAQASVVEDAARLRERIEFVFEQNKSDVLVEEYIEGRECYVGVIGNERLTRLPVWELDFGTMPANQSAIATRKVKWDLSYRSRYGIGSHPAVDLPAGVEAQLDRLSRRIYRALGLSGFARMDFRVRAGRQRLRAGGQCQSASGRARGLCAVRGHGGTRISCAYRAHPCSGSGLPFGVANPIWLIQLSPRRSGTAAP